MIRWAACLLPVSGCDLWLASSELGGRGVFAGRSFREGERIAVSRELLVEPDVVILSGLWYYAFQFEKQLLALLLGVASMLNHGEKSMVNVRFLRDSQASLVDVVASRDISKGEEFLTSYGSEDWFLDRHIAYKKLNESRLLANGTCLTGWARDGVARKGERIESPIFLLSRSRASRNAKLMEHCGAHPSLDFVFLPLLLPGHLDLQAAPNVASALQIWHPQASLAEALSHQAPAGLMRLEALTDLSTVALPVATRDWPPTWPGVHAHQALRSLAASGHLLAQFRLAEAARLDGREALPWYRQAAAQGHLEAQFRCGVLLQDLALRSDASVAREAERWYLEAAQQGHVRAQLLLAEPRNWKSRCSGG